MSDTVKALVFLSGVYVLLQLAAAAYRRFTRRGHGRRT
jgi:hypothetical protein